MPETQNGQLKDVVAPEPVLSTDATPETKNTRLFTMEDDIDFLKKQLAELTSAPTGYAYALSSSSTSESVVISCGFEPKLIKLTSFASGTGKAGIFCHGITSSATAGDNTYIASYLSGVATYTTTYGTDYIAYLNDVPAGKISTAVVSNISTTGFTLTTVIQGPLNMYFIWEAYGA